MVDIFHADAISFHFTPAWSVPVPVLCGCLALLASGPSVESKDVSKVDGALLDQVEADVYWCLTKLLDNIQVRCGECRARGCRC